MELIFNEVGGDSVIVATVEFPEDAPEREEFVAAVQAMVWELNAGLRVLSKTFSKPMLTLCGNVVLKLDD